MIKVNSFQNTKIKKKFKAVTKSDLSFGMNLNVMQTYRQTDENCIKYGIAKEFAASLLEDENVLYELYAGKRANDLIVSFISDEEFVEQLLQNPNFMQASVFALSKVLEEKLKDRDLGASDKKALSRIDRILSYQKKLYQNPENSFTDGVEKTRKVL